MDYVHGIGNCPRTPIGACTIATATVRIEWPVEFLAQFVVPRIKTLRSISRVKKTVFRSQVDLSLTIFIILCQLHVWLKVFGETGVVNCSHND